METQEVKKRKRQCEDKKNDVLLLASKKNEIKLCSIFFVNTVVPFFTLKDLKILRTVSMSFFHCWNPHFLQQASFDFPFCDLVRQETRRKVKNVNIVWARDMGDVPNLDDLPFSVESISMGKYDDNLPPGSLPLQLKSLELHYCVHPVQNGFPSGLLNLNLGFSFDQPILPNVLPNSLLALDFGYVFNQPLCAGTLPPFLQSLYLGKKFNYPIPPNTLPSSLTNLELLNNKFKHNFAVGVLPLFLLNLYVAGKVSFEHQNAYPMSLTTIYAPRKLNLGCVSQSSNHVSCLTIPYKSLQYVPTLFPSLQKLTIYFVSKVMHQKFNVGIQFPNSITELRLYTKRETRIIFTIEFCSIPSNLLIFDSRGLEDIGQIVFACSLPNSLQQVYLAYANSSIIAGPVIFSSSLTYMYLTKGLPFMQLPQSLTSLDFGSDFNQIIDPNVLPSTLLSLRLCRFDRHLGDSVFPQSLTFLDFGYSFNQSITSNMLPASLLTLKMGYAFNQKIDDVVFPNLLRYLSMGKVFNHRIVHPLPASLLILKIKHKYKYETQIVFLSTFTGIVHCTL